MFEGGAIAVLALGRKESDEPFNSEDLALLTAVAGQVATAIENGRLYRQLHLKAEEIGRMREFNENILESLDDGLAVVDLDERIAPLEPRARALLRRLARRRDRAPARRGLRRAVRRGAGGGTRASSRTGPRCVACRSQPGTGTAKPPAFWSMPPSVPLQRSVAGDAVVGAILLIEDITERVRLEEQLQISEKMASIGLLAAGVAHEVNTPLTGISSFTQMLLESADPADPKTVLLEKIERQTFRAAKIVNGLLNLSRPGTASERCLIDLNAVISDVFVAARAPVRGRQDQGPARARTLGRRSSGSSTSSSRCS